MQILTRRKHFQGGFSPVDLSGLELWLDASDIGTLFDSDVGGSTPADDAAIGRWEDKSGNDNHAAQSTSSLRPIRRDAEMNLNAVVDFDGTDDKLSLQSAITLSDFSAFAVFNRSAIGIHTSPFGGSTSFEMPYQWAAIDNKEYQVPDVGGFISSAASTDIGDFYITSIRDGSNGEIWRDGVSLVSGTVSTNTFNCDRVGEKTPNQYHSGFLSEVLIYNRALSTPDTAEVESYLSAKWGI